MTIKERAEQIAREYKEHAVGQAILATRLEIEFIRLIEECAAIAETPAAAHGYNYDYSEATLARHIAEEIRALKET